MTGLGAIAGSGWAAGLNLWAVGLVIGIAGRLDLYDAPPILEENRTLLILAVLYIIEFVVDKVPLLDSAWDTISTIIRPLGAALLGITIAGEQDMSTVTAGLTAGGLALSSHAAKATTRAAINMSPEPFTNIIASVVEDVGAIGFVAFALAYPRVALGIAIILGILAAILAFMLWRFVRRLRTKWRERKMRTQPA